MTHTDISDSYLIKRLPERLQPYAILARLDRPVGIWLLLLPGWWGIMLASGGLGQMHFHDWWIFILFGLGAVVMRGAGCIINDFWDRNLDKQVGRTKLRPLASGALNPVQVGVFLLGLLFVGLFILLQMNFVTRVLGILTLPLMAAYPLMKRYTWWPQAFLGLTFNFSAMMGWSAITGGLGLAPLLLYAGGIFWTLGYDTIYAHQDKEDDALAGIKSSALWLGTNSKKAVAGFYVFAWVLIAASGICADFHSLSFLFLLPALVHMAWQVVVWKPDNAESCLKIFKSNRDFGLLVLAVFALA